MRTAPSVPEQTSNGDTMGALTDMCDKFDNRDGYYIACYLYSVHGADLTDSELEDHVKRERSETAWERCGFFITLWYHRLCGEDYSIFLLYAWTFTKHPESIDLLKKIATDDPNLDYRERLSTDDDFFMFRPIEHSLGIELVVHNGLSPARLSRKLRGVIVDDKYAYGGCRGFFMEW